MKADKKLHYCKTLGFFIEPTYSNKMAVYQKIVMYISIARVYSKKQCKTIEQYY